MALSMMMNLLFCTTSMQRKTSTFRTPAPFDLEKLDESDLDLLAVKRTRKYMFFSIKTEDLYLEEQLKISTMICRSKIRRT